jgi:hypothetical protein
MLHVRRENDSRIDDILVSSPKAGASQQLATSVPVGPPPNKFKHVFIRM